MIGRQKDISMLCLTTSSEMSNRVGALSEFIGFVIFYTYLSATGFYEAHVNSVRPNNLNLLGEKLLDSHER